MARGRLFGIAQAALSLVCVQAGSQVASAQSVLNLKGASSGVLGITLTAPPSAASGGATVALPGVAIGGLVSVAPTSVNLSRNGATVITPSGNVLGLATISSGSAQVSGNGAIVVTPGASVANLANVTSATVSASSKGLIVSTPGISVANLATVGQATVGLSGSGATVALPTVNVAGISVAATPLNVNLSGGPLIGLPAVSVGVGSALSLNLPGGSIGDILNQTNSTTQMFSNIGSAQAMAPVEQMLNGFAFGDDAGAGGGGCAAAGALTPLAGTNVWMWNASTVQSTSHEGFRVRSSDGNECGSSTMPAHTQQTAQLPGFMFDASSALGLAPGTFRMGFSGGTTETDTQVKASAALRDAGINQASALQLKSWSLGTFSLLTGKNWYAGSAVGASWGEAESMNYVTGSSSDYSTTGLVAAGFVGTIVPLTETMRFDLRATLSHQRTVGDAHTDSLGIVYGDHTIQSTDASVSGRLFGVFRDGDLTIRPFVQAGVVHHLAYDNNLTIDGIGYQLLEADTTVFVATGVDFELARALQFSLGVRHEANSDLESWAGRVGLTYRFN
jgi:hypothetical protein